MSIELEPTELSFQRPLNREITQTLYITNRQDDPVAFKVKTTAPKQYCVRPNSGRVEPGRTVEVQVLLQPMRDEPPPNFKCRDKFLVQSVAISPEKESMSNVQQIWSYVEKNERSSIQEKKIRVVYTDADSGPHYKEDSELIDLDSHDITFANTTANHAISSPPQSPPASARDTRDFRPSKQQQDEPAAAAPKPAPRSTSSGDDDIRQKLAEATRTIEQLRAQLKENEGLRQRKGKATETATPAGTAVQPAQVVTEGIPMQIVAALCLISFLLAFFFF